MECFYIYKYKGTVFFPKKCIFDLNILLWQWIVFTFSGQKNIILSSEISAVLFEDSRLIFT